jgi:intracellular sulfur oxidation DsrE/DsrF family protein
MRRTEMRSLVENHKELAAMKRMPGPTTFGLIFSLCLLWVAAVPVFAGDYEALKDQKSVKAVFDIRNSNPDVTAMYLRLIHQAYQDKNIREVSQTPEFVLVFIGPPVKFVSKNMDGFSPEEKKTLAEIATLLSTMSKEGIRLEICMLAAQAFGVDAKSILPEFTRVNSGYISLIGYQGRGYSLVPIY